MGIAGQSAPAQRSSPASGLAVRSRAVGRVARRSLARHWPLAFPLLLTCFVLRVWLDPNVTIMGADFPSFSAPTMRGGVLGWPHLWADLSFGYSLSYWINTTPLWALAAPLQMLGAPFSVTERVLWLWPFAFGAPLCGYYLCYRFTRNAFAAAFGAWAFVMNSWTIGLIERGHLPSLDAAMLEGLAFPFFFDLIDRPSPKAAIRIAFIISLQLLYDVRYAYEALLVLTLIACMSLPRLLATSALIRLLGASAVLAVALFAFNLDIIVPSIFTPSAPSGWGTADAFLGASHFGSLLSSFSLYYPFYHWIVGTDGFAVTNVELPFVVTALVAWFGLIVTHRRRASRTLFAVGALGVVLLSESQGPFGGFNLALYQHVPGFVLFRDFTKFGALIIPAYATGLALAFVTAVGLARRWLGWRRQFAASCLVVASFAYLFVIRDVLNPLRASNFAAAVPLPPQARATEDFLQSNLGDARVLMVPGDVRFQQRDRSLASADASLFASFPPPAGFGLLNDGLAKTDTVFTMLSSPLAPALLAELRVKYIVIPDDKELYYPWEGRAQRWACIDFLRQQPWAREVKHFGENVIFALNEPVAPNAFFAPRPILVVGSPATMEGLAGTPLWTKNAAALLFAQMPPAAAWLSSVPNVAFGPTLIDPDYPVGRGSAAVLSQRLADDLAAERYRQRPFAAYVFSSAMITNSLLSWNLDSTFAFHFRTAQPNDARMRFLIEGRHENPTVLVQNSGEVHAVAGPAGAFAGRTVACGSSGIQRHEIDLPGSTISVPNSAAGKEIFVDNPCPVVYQATVALQVVSGDALPASFSVTSGSTTRQFTAPPAWLHPFGGANVEMSDVLLRPGLNLLQVTKSTLQPLFIASAYTISDFRETGGSFEPEPLALAIRHSQSGDLVYASIDVPRPGMHVGFVDLFGPLHLALTHHPICNLKYARSDVPGSFHLVLDMRERQSGKALSLWIPMEERQDADYDLYQVVRDAFLARFDDEVAYHAGDALWETEHFTAGAPSPDDYTLRSIRIAATWSVHDSTDVPHNAFLMLMRGIRLSTSSRSIGSTWSYAQADPVRTAEVAAKNFTLRGMRLLRVASAGGDDARIDAELTGFTPSGYRLATSLHVGDYVKLALQSDRRIGGTIIAESSDYVLIQDGDNPPQRIARGSIATILQQSVTRSATLEIPLAARFQATKLSFNVQRDEGLKVRLNLTYEAPDGTRESVSAVDREESDVAGLDIEPDFIHPGAIVAGTVYDLSVPIDVTLAQPSSAQWTGYDLDLWRIERYRFGGSRRRLVGLTLEFTEAQNDTPLIRQYSIAVSNLSLSRDRLLESLARGAERGVPLATLDGSPIGVRGSEPLPESSRYFVTRSQLGVVNAGEHVIQSRALDDVKIRAATLLRGSPASFLAGTVSEFDAVTPSEDRGLLTGAGVLVVSRRYDTDWLMATWPAGEAAPALTGFALLDWLRGLGHYVPRNYHVPANTNVDAWYVAPAGSQPQRFVMIYLPEALNELGFLLTLVLVSAGAFWLGLTTFMRGVKQA